MAKRIKYTDEGNGILVSTNLFRSRTTDAIYEVTIDTIQMVYKIKNVHTERIYVGSGETGKVGTVKTLMKNAKAHLEKFGVRFEKATVKRINWENYE